jgi:predicted RNase H-like nuclease
MPGAPQRGPALPYKLLAGVVPCPPGWLVVSGRLQGVSIFPEEPKVYSKLTDILDEKPAFTVIALAAPIGLPPDKTAGGRTCDREARRLLGWPRSGAIISAPPRSALNARTAKGIGVVTKTLLPRLREIDADIQPYWQRTVFEVHPELSYYQLNEDRPMRYGKRTALGLKERRALLEAKIQGVESALDALLPRVHAAHLLDGAISMWTARRIAARAVTRMPEDPEWDEQGLRMEIMR